MISPSEVKAKRCCVKKVSCPEDIAALVNLKHIVFELSAEMRYAQSRIEISKVKEEHFRALASVSKKGARSFNFATEWKMKGELWQGYFNAIKKAKDVYKKRIYETAKMILRDQEARWFVDELYPEDEPMLEKKFNKSKHAAMWLWYENLV